MIDPINISDAAERIEAGELAPLELVERCLDRIRQYDERIRAWVLVDDNGACQAARKLGEEIARGEYRGPLHGIPLGIKDIIDVSGLPSEAGSPIRKGEVAASDAPLVAALREAGAIILGKTVTVEFACFDPSPTRNPWDPELGHTPGGSSSGSAAAVAAGMCPAAIGTQTGGSLVRPASFCGIAAMKPTFGRVSGEGVIPVSPHLDHPGPMAASVDGLGILLECLPASEGFSPPEPAKPKRFGTSRPPRLGLVEKPFMERADDAVREAVQVGLARLILAGAAVEPVSMPEGFDELDRMHTRIMAVDAAQYHCRNFAAHRESYGPRITELLDEGLRIPQSDYRAALAHQRLWQSNIDSLLGQFDALIMPATDTTAPARLDTTGSKAFQSPWSYLGVPVISLPCCLAMDGMPAAVQLVGRPHADLSLLNLARWCEQKFEFPCRPPLSGGA